MAGESRTAVVAALIGNALIAATKYTAAAFTGSSAMPAGAIHSTSDTGNQLLFVGPNDILVNASIVFDHEVALPSEGGGDGGR